jgi:hypothetical protein
VNIDGSLFETFEKTQAAACGDDRRLFHPDIKPGARRIARRISALISRASPRSNERDGDALRNVIKKTGQRGTLGSALSVKLFHFLPGWPTMDTPYEKLLAKLALADVNSHMSSRCSERFCSRHRRRGHSNRFVG